MQRSYSVRYEVSKKIAANGHVDVTVIRAEPPGWQFRSASYSIELKTAATQLSEATLVPRKLIAIDLEAHFCERSSEIVIANIERRGLTSGQRFCKNTFLQLLSITPECKTMVLYNLMNREAVAAVEQARDTHETWLIPKESGVLLRALYECGFQAVVGFSKDGNFTYRCVRASDLNRSPPPTD